MDDRTLLLASARPEDWLGFFAHHGLIDERLVSTLSGVERGQNVILVQSEPVALAMARGPIEDTAEHDLRSTSHLARANGSQHGLTVRVDGDGRIALTVMAGSLRSPVRWSGNLRRLDAAGQEIMATFAESRDWLIVTLRLLERISRREIGIRFFKEIRTLVSRMDVAWTGIRDDADRRGMSILTLCRLLFIYFLRARRWIPDQGMLARMLLHPDASDLYRQTLEPLFFDALNQPANARRDGRFVTVPYLNGGLFAESAFERDGRPALPDAVIREVISLLERYRFVPSRDASSAPGLDPLLLSEVFEQLMTVDDRQRHGAFFTPPALVALTVEQAIADLIATTRHHATFSRLRTGLVADDEALAALREYVLRLRIVDPAVGSGAFLVGAYSYLSRLVDRIDATMSRGGGPPSQVARRTLVTQVLYGVDRSSTAVLITVLRLWLALAADTPEDADPEPLPNLQVLVRTGDSLLDNVDRNGPPLHLSDSEQAESRRLITALANAHGKAKELLERQVDARQRSLAVGVLSARLKIVEDELAALTRQGMVVGTAGSARGWSREERLRIEELRRRENELAFEIRSLQDERMPVPFDWRLHFPSDEGTGFDLVVGNPPWVRLSACAASDRRALTRRYGWLVSERGLSGFGSQADLSVAFVERATRLVREGGLVSLLVPSKLFSAGYASRMRASLRSEFSLIRLADFGDSAGRTFDATVYPALLTLRRSRPPNGHSVSIGTGDGCFDLDQSRLPLDSNRGAPWILLPVATTNPWRQLLADLPRLRDAFVPRQGIKTGANAVFVDPPEDVGPTVPCWTGEGLARNQPARLLFAHDIGSGEAHATVSGPTLTWLKRHEAVLYARSDSRPGTRLWELFRVSRESLCWRVVWRDIARELEARVVPPTSEGGPVVLNTLYSIACRDRQEAERLAEWLNSAQIRDLARATAEPASGGYRRYLATTIAALPLVSSLISASDTKVSQGRLPGYPVGSLVR